LTESRQSKVNAIKYKSLIQIIFKYDRFNFCIYCK
jgi:hypothetical protein